MSDFVLSCCSTADLAASHYVERDINVIPFHFIIDGVEHLEDGTMPIDKFYREIEEGKMTATSPVSVEEYKACFEEFLEQGKDILHLTLSSGISKTYDSAIQASGVGLMMDKLADLRDEGKNIDEIREFAENNKLRLNHWFFSTDLTYYVRGGRISKADAIIGNMLNICPLMTVNNEGRLIFKDKIRKKKKVCNRIVEIMEKLADDGNKYSDKCYISMSACLEDAQHVAMLIRERFPYIKGKRLEATQVLGLLHYFSGVRREASKKILTTRLFCDILVWRDERGLFFMPKNKVILKRR